MLINILELMVESLAGHLISNKGCKYAPNLFIDIMCLECIFVLTVNISISQNSCVLFEKKVSFFQY